MVTLQECTNPVQRCACLLQTALQEAALLIPLVGTKHATSRAKHALSCRC